MCDVVARHERPAMSRVGVLGDLTNIMDHWSQPKKEIIPELSESEEENIDIKQQWLISDEEEEEEDIEPQINTNLMEEKEDVSDREINPEEEIIVNIDLLHIDSLHIQVQMEEKEHVPSDSESEEMEIKMEVFEDEDDDDEEEIQVNIETQEIDENIYIQEDDEDDLDLTIMLDYHDELDEETQTKDFIDLEAFIAKFPGRSQQIRLLYRLFGKVRDTSFIDQ